MGYSLSAPMDRCLRDCKRSCLRGLGGPVKARALPLARLHELPEGRTPWVPGGPLNPRAAVLCGAWWQFREVELSTARAALAELYRQEGQTLVA